MRGFREEWDLNRILLHSIFNKDRLDGTKNASVHPNAFARAHDYTNAPNILNHVIM